MSDIFDSQQSLDSRFEILRDDLAEAEDAEDYEDPLKACNSSESQNIVLKRKYSQR